jgi:hypothetical protein
MFHKNVNSEYRYKHTPTFTRLFALLKESNIIFFISISLVAYNIEKKVSNKNVHCNGAYTSCHVQISFTMVYF